MRTVTGELERASETLELYRQVYPRDYRAASNLANVDSMLGHIYVRSERAGQRVMESVTRYITQRLKLKVNAAKSAVVRPQKRTFLGFSFTASPEIQRAIAPKALALSITVPMSRDRPQCLPPFSEGTLMPSKNGLGQLSASRLTATMQQVRLLFAPARTPIGVYADVVNRLEGDEKPEGVAAAPARCAVNPQR